MHHKENKNDWLEALKRQRQTCPHCGQCWLIVGVKNGEEHPCRDCGKRFVIKLVHCLNDWPLQEQGETRQSRSLQTASANQAAAK